MQQVPAYQSDAHTPSKTSNLDLSSLLQLRRFTVRVNVFSRGDAKTFSCLPAAVRICGTASHLHHLTISICVGFHASLSSLSEIGFYPLVDLAKFSPAFDRVDIYVYSTRGYVSRDDILDTLAEYEGVEDLIERGVWVLHVQEVAPTDPRFLTCPSTSGSKFHTLDDNTVAIG